MPLPTSELSPPWENFKPVRTLEELLTLDEAEIKAGYVEYVAGDPEPGPNRGKAYWHGARNAANDRGQFGPDSDLDAIALIKDMKEHGYRFGESSAEYLRRTAN